MNLPPSLTIGLLWHSLSSDNLGVGALTESQIAICNDVAAKLGIQLRYLILGTRGRRDYTPPGQDIRNGSPISFKELLMGRSPFFSEIGECDLVLDIGEGDSFADIYGLRRFRMQLSTKLAVLIKNKPLVLSPQTIGPFDRWYTRSMAKWTMQRCQQVFARDGLSAGYLDSLGLDANVDEAIDLAFKLPYRHPEMRQDDRPRIGVNVSGLLYSGGYQGGNQFGLSVDYPQLIRALLTHWCAEERNEVWLIPHVLSDLVPADDDRVAIAELVREFPQARQAPEFHSPSEAKSFIAGMDFMTGARMHACIAALSSGVPVVPLAYSRKFNGLFASLNYNWLADGKTMDNQQAMDAILNGFVQRDTLRDAARAAASLAIARLATYESHIATLLSNLVARNP